MKWHNAKTNPPEPLHDVLIAVKGFKECSEAFLIGPDRWQYSTGHLVEGEVYAWTELPACPVIIPEPVERSGS